MRVRAFRQLFVAYTISVTGDALVPITLVFGVLGAGGSAGDLAIVLAAGSIPQVALTVFGGALADRVDRKRLLMASDIVRMFAQAGLALSFATGSLSITVAAAVSFVMGTARSFFAPTLQALIPEICKGADLQKANSWIQTMRNICFLGGTPLAGVLVATFGPSPILFYDALTYGVGAVLVARVTVLDRVVRDGGPTVGLYRDIMYGFREVSSRRWLLAELSRSALELPLVVAPFFILGPVIAESNLNGAVSWAWISTAFTAGAALGPMIALRVRPAKPMLVCTLIMYTGVVPPLLLALTDSTVAIATAEGIKGCAVGFFGAVWSTLLQTKIPDRSRGKVNALDYTLTNGLLPVGYLLAAPLGVWLGAVDMMLVSAAWVAVGVTVQLAVPSVRRLRYIGVDDVAR